MSINTRAMAGYLMSKGLDKRTAHIVAEETGETPYRKFADLVGENKRLIGKKEALQLAATICLNVRGKSQYPLNQVKAIVACLAKDCDSLHSVLNNENYFDVEQMNDLLRKTSVEAELEVQFQRSHEHRIGFLGLFS